MPKKKGKKTETRNFGFKINRLTYNRIKILAGKMQEKSTDEKAVHTYHVVEKAVEDLARKMGVE